MDGRDIPLPSKGEIFYGLSQRLNYMLPGTEEGIQESGETLIIATRDYIDQWIKYDKLFSREEFS